jgi:hypothetical protein
MSTPVSNSRPHVRGHRGTAHLRPRCGFRTTNNQLREVCACSGPSNWCSDVLNVLLPEPAIAFPQPVPAHLVHSIPIPRPSWAV